MSTFADGSAETTRLQGVIASAASVSTSDVTLTVAAGSIVVSATVTVEDAATASAVQDGLSAAMPDAAAASSLLGITVTSAPSVQTRSIWMRMRSVPSADQPTDAGIGLYVVAAAAILAVVGLAAICFSRRGNDKHGTIRVARVERRARSAMPFDVIGTAAPSVTAHRGIEMADDEIITIGRT